jgi:4-carboxymuconolactone decarboxylase
MTTSDNTAKLFATINAVAPALAAITQEHLVKDLWSRPGLSPRDRALVTLSILVARNATLAYPHYVNKALDCGVTPTEISELLTHLGFYTSLANAFGAIAVVQSVFEQRGISPDSMPAVHPELLPIETVVPDEQVRAKLIADQVAPASDALQHYTNDLLYAKVWTRPGLAPRDRSLATGAALVALGQSHFYPVYLNRARALGVTREEFGEALAHVAFYAGWGLAVLASPAAINCWADPGI